MRLNERLPRVQPLLPTVLDGSTGAANCGNIPRAVAPMDGSD
jgi:hypothetical protein